MNYTRPMQEAGPGPSAAGHPPQLPHSHTKPLEDAHVGKAKKGDKKTPGGPVKTACLSCRNKKAKCDGGTPVCGQCSRKQIKCVYIKSKRGGARVSKNRNPPTPLVDFLKKLDSFLNVRQFGLIHHEPQEGDDPTNIVRTFGSREEIFRCYYNEVHPYLPVMPPRHYLVDVLPTLLPNSPFLLASQTIMTLVPHPLDPCPQSAESKRLRSAASAALGKQALAAVELTLATTSSLEVVQALTILGVWEWGSTNDALTAIAKYNWAVQVAIEMGIHNMDANGNGYALEGIDWRLDARRRTWWLLYVYQLSAALVSGNAAPVSADDDRIHVDFPICSDKDRTWGTWANCIRQCYRVVNLVNEIVFANGGPQNTGAGWGAPVSNLTPPGNQSPGLMVEVDKQIMLLMKETERLSVIERVPGGEEDVATNQQIATRLSLAVAHIHIHRWTAFPEVSLFSKRICGLSQTAVTVTSDEDSTDEFGMSYAGSAISHGSHNGSGMSHPETGFSDISGSPLLHPPAPQAGTPQSMPSPHNIGPSAALGGLPPMQPPQFGLPPASVQVNNFGMGEANRQFGSNNVPLITVPQPAYDGQQDITGGSVFRNHEVMEVDQMITSLSPALPPIGNNPPAQQQYNTSPLSDPAALPGNYQQHQFSPPATYNNNMNSFTPLLESVPPRSSSLNATSSVSAAPVTSFDSHGYPPSLNVAIPSDPMQPTPAFDPTLQQHWHSDLQQATYPEPPYSAISDDMWQPDSYPNYLPQPWFSRPHGAGAMTHFGPEDLDIQHYPAIEAAPVPQAPSSNAGSTTSKKHKAWGVDASGAIEPNAVVEAAERGETFPPGISLARCATAAHTIVRLEVLHRSAALAMDGIPRWIPFCSCGLVSGAYAFLLLILAVHAENDFQGGATKERLDEVENLLTNVRVILAGLEAYGIMWEGIDMMAREVRAVVEAAASLPTDIRRQASNSPSADTHM